MFAGQRRLNAIAYAMDKINGRFGRNAVHSAAMMGTDGAAPTRIPFGAIPEEGDF